MIAHLKRQTHQDVSTHDKRSRQEKALDEALKNAFPASDPVSIVQPAGRDFRSEPNIEGRDNNPRGQ
jgi:hypothetical protein